MKELQIADISEKAIKQLSKGALLTVKDEDKVNTMTIGWGTLGRVWNKPVFTAMVRYSRFTHELISNADSFTVSFSTDDSLKHAINVCGTRSGRSLDKIKECNLNLEYVDDINSPYIAEGNLHLICKIIYKSTMEPALLSEEVKKRWYKDNDYHVIYYGEVLKVLAKE